MAGTDDTNPTPAQEGSGFERTPVEQMQPVQDIDATRNHPVRGPKEPPPDPPTRTK